jgi:hypothetical protein
MAHVMEFIRRLNAREAAILGLVVAATHVGAFAAGRVMVVREATAVINEANRRIEHLNGRLAVALEEAPESCPAPPPPTTKS